MCVMTEFFLKAPKDKSLPDRVVLTTGEHQAISLQSSKQFPLLTEPFLIWISVDEADLELKKVQLHIASRECNFPPVREEWLLKQRGPFKQVVLSMIIHYVIKCRMMKNDAQCTAPFQVPLLSFTGLQFGCQYLFLSPLLTSLVALCHDTQWACKMPCVQASCSCSNHP